MTHLVGLFTFLEIDPGTWMRLFDGSRVLAAGDGGGHDPISLC